MSWLLWGCLTVVAGGLLLVNALMFAALMQIERGEFR